MLWVENHTDLSLAGVKNTAQNCCAGVAVTSACWAQQVLPQMDVSQAVVVRADRLPTNTARLPQLLLGLALPSTVMILIQVMPCSNVKYALAAKPTNVDANECVAVIGTELFLLPVFHPRLLFRPYTVNHCPSQV